MKNSIVFACLVSSILTFAQKNVYLTISHVVGDNALAFNQNYTNDLGQSYELTRLNYYISSLKIIHDGGQILSVDDSKHLLLKGNSHAINLLGNFDVNQVEGITFSIGVHPSLNNADPSLQPEDSPLYFQTPTMHWGWAPGYFFVCLEGKCGTTIPLNFQLHGLWNQNYFQQTVNVAGVENASGDIYIHLDADINEALKGVQINNCPISHGDNLEDLKVLENFRDYVFSAGDGSLLSLENEQAPVELDIFPNPVQDQLFVRVTHGSNKPVSLRIVDISGREMNAQLLTQETATISTEFLTSGVYFVQLISDEGILSNQKIVKN